MTKDPSVVILHLFSWNLTDDEYTEIVLIDSLTTLTFFQTCWYGARSGCESDWSTVCSREELQKWDKIVKYASLH